MASLSMCTCRIWQIYLDGSLCLIGNFQSLKLGKKSLFQEFSSETLFHPPFPRRSLQKLNIKQVRSLNKRCFIYIVRYKNCYCNSLVPKYELQTPKYGAKVLIILFCPPSPRKISAQLVILQHFLLTPI